MSKTTLSHLMLMKHHKQKMACLTAYDASFAYQVSQAGTDIILVGDSLGMVIQGLETTVPVTLEQMVYHTKAVANGIAKAEHQAFLMADLPFMTYATPEQCYQSSAQLMQAGAQMVKLEGGHWLIPTIKGLTERGISVCGHLGLTPQSVDILGGYKVQGRDNESAKQILHDAKALVEAGVKMLVLECVPTPLAKQVADSVAIPVIGIGAGPDTDAQVLVLTDMLGITPGFKAKFVKDFMVDANNIPEALAAFVKAVKSGEFPAAEHCFS